MTRFSSTIVAMSVLGSALLVTGSGCATTQKSHATAAVPAGAVADATVLVHGVT